MYLKNIDKKKKNIYFLYKNKLNNYKFNSLKFKKKLIKIKDHYDKIWKFIINFKIFYNYVKIKIIKKLKEIYKDIKLELSMKQLICI
jgi:hypothetical protein